MLIALISFLFLSRESPPRLLKILLQFVQIFLFGGVKKQTYCAMGAQDPLHWALKFVVVYTVASEPAPTNA